MLIVYIIGFVVCWIAFAAAIFYNHGEDSVNLILALIMAIIWPVTLISIGVFLLAKLLAEEAHRREE